MAYKQGNHQLELFSEAKDSSGIKSRAANNLFLAYIWNYEKTILIIISIVITGIISFSLGVERGKKISLSNNNSRFDVALKIQHTTPKPVYPVRTENTPDATKETKIIKEYIQVYTIQLASYKTKVFADKEAEALKKKGLLPLVLSKGGYMVLCVGNFDDKKSAQPLLSELKRRYQGCYIRRL